MYVRLENSGFGSNPNETEAVPDVSQRLAINSLNSYVRSSELSYKHITIIRMSTPRRPNLFIPDAKVV
jgi:hypothetical protein